MLNIEKHKEEILKYTGKQYSTMCLIHEDIMKKNDCTGNCSKCRRETIEWLTSESKEPVLTEKEKAYLKNVIEPRRDEIVCIAKRCRFEGRKDEHNSVHVFIKLPISEINVVELLDFPIIEDMPFNGLELNKEYTLEELGL